MQYSGPGQGDQLMGWDSGGGWLVVTWKTGRVCSRSARMSEWKVLRDEGSEQGISAKRGMQKAGGNVESCQGQDPDPIKQGHLIVGKVFTKPQGL